MGKKDEKVDGGANRSPKRTALSAPLETEGTFAGERSAQKEKASKRSEAKRSAKEIDGKGLESEQVEEKAKKSKKEKKEKKKRTKEEESNAAVAEEIATNEEEGKQQKEKKKKKQKHKNQQEEEEPQGSMSSAVTYSTGDLSKSLFGDSSSIPEASLFSAIPQAPARSVAENEDDDEDDDEEEDEDDEEIEEDESDVSSETKAVKEKHTKEKLARTVFVGNVPVTIDRKELKKLFKDYGKIESVRLRSVALAKQSLSSYRKAGILSKQLHPLRSTCNAYVVFASRAEAEEALELNNHLLGDKHLHVDLADSTDKYKEADLCVFVGNLPFEAEDEDVRQHFAACGDIEYVRLVRDKETNVGKGIGYVKFADRDGVAAALLLHGHQFQNKRELRVTAAKSHKVEPKRNAAKRGRGAATRGGFSRGEATAGRGGGRGGFSGRGATRGGATTGGGFSRGGATTGRGFSRGGATTGRGFSRGGATRGRGGFSRGGDATDALPPSSRWKSPSSSSPSSSSSTLPPSSTRSKPPSSSSSSSTPAAAFEGRRAAPGELPRLKKPRLDPHKAAQRKKHLPKRS